MKTIAVIFLAFFIVQTTVALDCPSGYYDAGNPKCERCYQPFKTCTAANNGTAPSTVVGWSTVADLPTAYCLTTGSYNKEKDICTIECKAGCWSCSVDYDYCTECQNGFIWNPDYTCLPAVIGLSAASLALLTIGIVFLVISCCYVKKAIK